MDAPQKTLATRGVMFQRPTWKETGVWVTVLMVDTHQNVRQKKCLKSTGIKYKTRQGRQCRYNVTVRPVRATVVAVGKQHALHIVCVCV
jgi:hypothetical protein